MVTKRFPHTATLSYVAPGTMNTTGYWTEGTLATIMLLCDIQPVATGRGTKQIIGAGGDVIPYKYTIFCDPNTGFSAVPDGANLTFFDKEHILLQLDEYQHHVEMLC